MYLYSFPVFLLRQHFLGQQNKQPRATKDKAIYWVRKNKQTVFFLNLNAIIHISYCTFSFGLGSSSSIALVFRQWWFDLKWRLHGWHTNCFLINGSQRAEWSPLQLHVEFEKWLKTSASLYLRYLLNDFVFFKYVCCICFQFKFKNTINPTQRSCRTKWFIKVIVELLILAGMISS